MKKRNEMIMDYANQKQSIKDYISAGLGGEPSIYVGTYYKYNNGSIFGAWLDLSLFCSYDEFLEVCQKLHADEDDPEFMFQDFENFPEQWYSESGIGEETFNKIIEYCNMEPKEREAYDAYITAYGDDDIEDFSERYVGAYESEEDFAQECVDNTYTPKESLWMLDYFDVTKYSESLFSSGYTFCDGYVFRDC